MTPEVKRLVRQAQEGDRAAFDALAALYRTRLESLVRIRLVPQLKGHVDPNDIIQETLLRAFGSLSRFRWEDEGSFFRWLRGIGVNVILEAVRRTGRDRYLALDFEVSSEEPSPSRAAQRRERQERLEKAIAGLTSDQRAVIRLVRLEGKGVAEAARILERSPNAVSQLLIRALRKLRENFGDTASLGLPEGPLDMGDDRRD